MLYGIYGVRMASMYGPGCKGLNLQGTTDTPYTLAIRSAFRRMIITSNLISSFKRVYRCFKLQEDNP
ncbi:hypothetical protein VN97_g7576 [Penicillium thymicola]|uniref:Uncharacterized protein n=1 Tax=Penicillium thymicola TaxID=293382 RepID=A0AAI9TER4_PENTH|nr:hypothetical protein VN97_g7576 [Penicillium thymicola]